MESGKAIQVVLLKDGQPVRILLEKPFRPHGTLSVLLDEGEATARVLGGHDQDLMIQRFADAGEEGALPLRVARGWSASGDLVVLSEDSPTSVLDTGDGASEPPSYPFLTRPLPVEQIRHWVEDSASAAEAEKRPCGEVGELLIGESSELLKMLGIVERVARSDATVLIQGETGTGKTVVARILHEVSTRARQPFVVVNCGAFQDQLLESELFGHEKGAFTGAATAKAGLFEVADGGTLFLDEVTEMSPAMQAKLLQVLDSGEMRRVGSTRDRSVDVRIVSATNRSLAAEVEAGRFREDLFFRLKVITLDMPPLRERREDIPALVDHFLQRHRMKYGREKKMSSGAMLLLMGYHWPGNVRELANVVEGLVLLAPEDSISSQDLPANLRSPGKISSLQPEQPLSMKEVERLHMIQTLRFTEGNKAAAARILGIDVKTLTNKIRLYEIEL